MGMLGSIKKFFVFDFDQEEEPVEITPSKFPKKKKSKKKSKKKNPKINKSPRPSDYSPVDKYKFLSFFSQGTEEEEKKLNEPIRVDSDDKIVAERVSASNAATQSRSSHQKTDTWPEPILSDSRTISSGPDFSQNDPVHINLDDDNDNEFSSQVPSFDIIDSAGPSGEQVLENCSSEYDIEPIVVIYPKQVTCGKKRYWKTKMTFSCNTIKLDALAEDGIASYVLEWKTADLIKIKSKWCEPLETATVCLHFKSKDENVADDAKSSDAGIVGIKISLSDPHWSEKEETIKLLDVRYIDKWDVDLSFDAFFEEVVYPDGDPDSVTITMRDIELLQPERFVNDTIVDFYIKYLKNRINPEDSHRFHFFNSFFFPKLRACRGSEAFQLVRKWTKKVNIFQKDYIFIPVNFSLHWSLIIICHPGELVDFSDELTEKSGKVPCILHLDSIKGSHRGLRNLIQSYLCKEWKERSTNPAKDVASKFSSLQFLSLELPQQQNLFDCGLFLLHYMELFVEQAPANFNPLGVSNVSKFLGKDWFPPAAASLKRGHIKKLIYEIAKHNSQKVPLSTCHGNCSDITGLKDKSAEESLQEAYNLNEECHNALQPFLLTPIAAKPLRSVYSGGREFAVFGDQRLNEGSPVDRNALLFEQIASRDQFINSMSPVEEGEETFDLTTCSPQEEEEEEEEECGLQLPMITGHSLTNIRRKDAHLENPEDQIQISRTNCDKYPLPSEVHEKESYALALCESSQEYAEDIHDCSSESSGELEGCVIEDSLEENGQLDAGVSGISPCRKRLFDPTQNCNTSCEDIFSNNQMPPQVHYVVEDSQEEIDELNVRKDTENYRTRGRLFDSYNQKRNLSSRNSNVAVSRAPPMSDSDEPRLTKRPRVMSPRTERKVTSRLSKGIEEIVICE